MANPEPRTPKVDAIQRALKIFTVEQFNIFLDECEERARHGFGDVVVVFDNHHPQRVRNCKDRYLPKPSGE